MRMILYGDELTHFMRQIRLQLDIILIVFCCLLFLESEDS